MKRLGMVGLLVVVAGVIAVLWWSRQVDHTAMLPSNEGATPSAPVAVVGRSATPALTDAGARTERPRPGTQVIASFGWGAGEGQLGRDRPHEGNPEAPMSLTVGSSGEVVILDQINHRLVKLDRAGKPAGTMPLTVQAPQDVAIAKDGTTVVMDRLVDHSIALMGPDGKSRGELPLLGKGMREGGASTGVFTDGNDVYVEREHGDLVKVGDTSGKRDETRDEAPGRPSRDGQSWLSAMIANSGNGQVLINSIDKQTREHRFTRQLVLGPPVVSLMLLDSDRSGVIYLAGVVALPTQSPTYAISLVCLDPLDGRLLGRATLPPNGGGDETFRQFTVPDEGGVLFLQRTEEGAQVLRVNCQ
jgi:hypothetical protein